MAKKFRQIRKALAAEGSTRVRQAGSHETWESADGTRVVTVAGKDSDTVGHAGCDSPRDRDRRTAMNYYLVIYERAEDGAWGAHSPDVEGVFALGETREEVEARMPEALSARLSSRRELGQPVPEPHTDAARAAA